MGAGGGSGCSGYIKNKLKSEIISNKKSLQTKMFFSAITKNVNWEILTKNLVTFKRWDGVKDEKLEHYRDSLTNLIFRGSVHKKPIYREELPNKGGGGGVWRFSGLRGGGGGLDNKEGDSVFEEGANTPMYTIEALESCRRHIANWLGV